MMKSDMFSSLSVTQMRQLRSRLLSELAQELESLEPVKAIAIDTWSKEAVKHGASQDHDGWVLHIVVHTRSVFSNEDSFVAD